MDLVSGARYTMHEKIVNHSPCTVYRVPVYRSPFTMYRVPDLY